MLRPADFRRVYDQGTRFQCALFTAFCLAQDRESGPRIGFTLPRALGKATRRNRMKRRIREAIRLRLGRIAPRWDIVINPRRTILDAPWAQIEKEVERLVARCESS
ncbi:MAG: ribonuclease P protein component [Bryobacteraceae bacterium]|nr:ribonuclease P protein component [Bryobacteraceae bacterium]MDW8378273.1 ribonuclease P protein component [Bryobacterales bacterium]